MEFRGRVGEWMFKIPFSNLNSELKLNTNFSNFFAYFEVKNGIIFAYRWRGESRAIAACLEHA